ncbi:hypothetical protein N7539_009294 [Penicillium diatomitis]|uniref:Beta-lactamase-related domain-containing protein n=1 Tax=Penicillium diatomitis TaxID=2819901 RepID=A0A9W9WLK2_9EURO|nr:uncharacterized protein N7539_009294 [Penicillium diatomitis]KAJ5469676.1 hypothetical protein N7539_009294 [Penicillium diatomitis]
MAIIVDPFDQDFDTAVERGLEEWKVPGISIAVVRDGHTFSKAYGLATFPNKPMTTDNLFSAASTTKAFTAAATSMIIEDSKDSPSPINWDTPLASIIPEDFVLSDEYATAHTTLEDALSHRSGLPGHGWGLLCGDRDGSVRENVRTLRYLPLSEPPRTKLQYSNQMFIAVGHAMQKVSGQPLGSFLKKRIWGPLGMEQTFFSKEEAREIPKIAAKMATGYGWVAEKTGGHWVDESKANWRANTAGGSIVSSVLDYSRWVRELIDRGGPLKGHDSLFKPRTLCFDQDPTDLPTPYHAYALGWFVWMYRGQHLYSHTGGWPGFSTFVGIIPDKRFGIVLMANSTSARFLLSQLSVHLMDKLLGPASDPLHERNMAEFFARQEKEKTKLVEYQNEDIEVIKKRLFPSIACPRVPHALPLERYTGVYKHPTGSWMKVVLAEYGHLSIQNSHAPIALNLDLIHASGEFFVAKTPSSNSLPLDPLPAEFYVNTSGKAQRVGLAFEPALGKEKIWFERVDS